MTGTPLHEPACYGVAEAWGTGPGKPASYHRVGFLDPYWGLRDVVPKSQSRCG